MIAEVVHRGGEPIGAVRLGDPSQFPQRVLEPLAEALETLGEADGAGLPVGVSQDEVIDQVIERLAGERDAQVVHGREVGGAQLAGRVDLIEEDLLGRALGGPPRLDLPLQGAELAVGEPAWEAALEVLEQGLGLKPRVECEPVAEFGPDLLERILPGLPGSWGERFTRQPIGVPVLPSRLGVHTHLQSRKREGMSLAEELAKPANLGVLDHGGSLLAQEETA